MNNITLDTAVEILEALGSHEDPIIRRGKEYTPRELTYEFAADTIANRFVVEFCTKGGRWTRGTLTDLILERMGVRERDQGNPVRKRRRGRARRPRARV